MSCFIVVRYRIARSEEDGADILTVAEDDVCTMQGDECPSMGYWVSKFNVDDSSVRYQFEDANVSTTYFVSYDKKGRAISIRRDESNPVDEKTETFSIERNEAHQLTRLSGSLGTELSYCYPDSNTVVIAGVLAQYAENRRVLRYRFDNLGRLTHTERGSSEVDCPERFNVQRTRRLSFRGNRLGALTSDSFADSRPFVERFFYDCAELPDDQ